MYLALAAAYRDGDIASPDDVAGLTNTLRPLLTSHPFIASISAAHSTRSTFRFHREHVPFLITQFRVYVNDSYQTQIERVAPPGVPITHANWSEPVPLAFDPWATEWWARGSDPSLVNVTDGNPIAWKAPLVPELGDATDPSALLIPYMEASFRLNFRDSDHFSVFRIQLGVNDMSSLLDIVPASDIVIVAADGSLIAGQSDVQLIEYIDSENPSLGARNRRVWEVPGLDVVTEEYLQSAGGPFAGGYLYVSSATARGDLPWRSVIRTFAADVAGVEDIARMEDSVFRLQVWIITVASAVVALIVLSILTVYAVSRARVFAIRTDTQYSFEMSDVVMGQLLGVGGFGEVYHGTLNDGRAVAVKILKTPAVTKQEMRAFVSEATAMAQLRHPDIVDFVGIIATPPDFAILSDFMPRGSLFAALHRPYTLYDMTLQIAWLRGIVSGLRFLHARNILHRDLKSLNILLTVAYMPKISDFGTATLAESVSATGNEMDAVTSLEAGQGDLGSIFWSAPEILSPTPIHSEASDIYALGILLWEIVSNGADLYPDIAASSVAHLVVHENLRPPTSILPPRFIELYSACVDTETQRRPTLAYIAGVLDDVVPPNTTPVLPSDCVPFPTGPLAVLGLTIPDLAHVLSTSTVANGEAYVAAICTLHEKMEAIAAKFSGVVAQSTLRTFIAVFPSPQAAILAAADAIRSFTPLASDAATAYNTGLAIDDTSKFGFSSTSVTETRSSLEPAVSSKASAPASASASAPVKRNQVAPATATPAIAPAQADADADADKGSLSSPSASLSSSSSSSPSSSSSSSLQSSSSEEEEEEQTEARLAADVLGVTFGIGVSYAHGSTARNKSTYGVIVSGLAKDQAMSLARRGRPGVAIVAESAVAVAAIDYKAEGLEVGPACSAVDGVPAVTMGQSGAGVVATHSREDAQVAAAARADGDSNTPWLLFAVPPHISLTDRVGIGSATEVFAAMFRNKDCVIKKALPRYIPLRVQGYLAHLAARCQSLNSPNVAPLLGAVVAPDNTSLLVPWYNKCLADLFDNGAVEPTYVTPKSIGLDVVAGLQALAAADMVHGKISLANVVLTEAGTAVVTDYALMPLLTSAQTMTGASHVYYMAPELLRGEAPTTHSDVYALGIVLYQLITGRIDPYEGTSAMAVVFKVIQGDLTPDLKNVAPDWAALLSSTWAHVPGRRPSLTQLSMDLAALPQ
ncbi:TKL/DRK protein kinase [Thecamonas trahens ATCC 50062]|uniref:TKL/DRK protein kinase n=1 Tax=Thecamonas trahens ATCC 50062 TaxID=461836 RepID=A0A0L0DRE9_THETB|nr:TKL/DRK protein kinase [Thecamonas trahens ATCC 50062]KNC54865.1 TKL/DRK protein kinase [Thecamonas trahens ATCC 50062]|eukprot:XP_013753462.1 TKL/DRK protein kinase [Thecamonas trahens ATCC 50062]